MNGEAIVGENKRERDSEKNKVSTWEKGNGEK
jgi:hypothetical protein